jgi:peptidoglycan/xylan/chitin deacetylase (PgdA/CDA1 family)
MVVRCVLMLAAMSYSLLYLGSKLIKGEEAVVLAYHSVNCNSSFYTVTPEEFYKQMEYLRTNYNIVPIEDVVEFAAGRRTLPNKAVAITLDDGYNDNFSHVYPYLKRHSLPATVFVSTGYVGHQFLLGGFSLKMLSWDQIVEMSRSNVAIGAHTVTHPDLCKESHENARRDIKMSKEQIEGRTGKRVRYMAYPSDRFNHDIIELVRSLGFDGAFGGEGLVRRGDCTLALNRIQVDRFTSFLMFRARMTKATLWYNEVWRCLRNLRRFPLVSAVYDKCETAIRIYRGT